MGKSPMVASAIDGQKPHGRFGDRWAQKPAVVSSEPVKWCPSSCQMRRRSANAPLVRCNALFALNALGVYPEAAVELLLEDRLFDEYA
uniref:Uncharacterized protein n=1 Tax=Meloidogyne incognita TaxID=6306 RepID=A0A914KL69_MELIC